MISNHTQFDHQPHVRETTGLPTILVQGADGAYVGIEWYYREATTVAPIAAASCLKILVCSQNGDAYLQPRMMRDLDSIKNTTHLAKALRAAGLPQFLRDCDNHQVPPVISQIEDDLFVPGAPRGVSPERTFFERSYSNRLPGKGSFISLKVYLAHHSNMQLTEEQSRILERAKSGA